jgi:hypothetical protein
MLAMDNSNCHVEWIISLNNNDDSINDYEQLFEGEAVTIIKSDSTNMVQATNIGAMESSEEILILVSDDMFPCDKWDSKIINEYKRLGKSPAVLQVHDTIRCDILTIPIMNRSAYELIGYIYHPKYLSMYADNDLTQVCKKLEIYNNALHIQFEHKHYTTGKSKIDETYRKENSKLAYIYGQRIYDYRKKQGFPIV